MSKFPIWLDSFIHALQRQIVF